MTGTLENSDSPAPVAWAQTMRKGPANNNKLGRSSGRKKSTRRCSSELRHASDGFRDNGGEAGRRGRWKTDKRLGGMRPGTSYYSLESAHVGGGGGDGDGSPLA